MSQQDYFIQFSRELTKRTAYVKLRAAALPSTTKVIYQKIIDEIDEQLSKLGN